jgi:hypothetical protein
MMGLTMGMARKRQIYQVKSLGNGGERGIRTLETVPRLHTFQACAFDHSATSPSAGCLAVGGAGGKGASVTFARRQQNGAHPLWLTLVLGAHLAEPVPARQGPGDGHTDRPVAA